MNGPSSVRGHVKKLPVASNAQPPQLTAGGEKYANVAASREARDGNATTVLLMKLTPHLTLEAYEDKKERSQAR